MRPWDFSRFAFSSCVATSMLAGCGGSQPPVGAMGSTSQTTVAASRGSHGGSWISPDAKNEDLVYVGDTEAYVYVLSYPKAKYLETIALPVPNYPENGLCSDLQGNVYIPTFEEGFYNSYIYEYGHGATSPKRTLIIDGLTALSCSVDPRTGDLAIGGWTGTPQYPVSELAVFRKAKGQPALYTEEGFEEFRYCAYDDQGDVFASGTSEHPQLAELPRASSTLRNIAVKTKSVLGPLQWDGQHLAITAARRVNPFPEYDILRLRIVGSSATVIAKAPLITRRHRLDQTWIQNSIIIAPPEAEIGKAKIEMWQYPAGGEHIRIKPVPARYTRGVTVSTAAHAR